MMNDKNGKMEELKDQKRNRPLKKSLLMRLSSARNSGVIKAFSMMLAVMIVFGTTYSLILPAITVDQESAEEMPGVYLEEEIASDGDYGVQDEGAEFVNDDGSQDADAANVFDDGSQDADYEEVYEESVLGTDDAEVNEDNEWPAEDGATDEEYTNDEYADMDEADVETAEDEFNDGELVINEEEDNDAGEYTDSSAETPVYTYQETRLENASPVQTGLLGDVTFRLDYNSSAEIPDGSTLSASEIDSYAETEGEAAYKEWRLENLTNSADALIADFDADWSWKDAAFFDVELNDPEGNIRQPASQIYLTVYFTNALYTDKVQFVRFIANEETDTETPEIMDPVDLGYTEDGGIYAGVFLVDTITTFGVITGDSLQAISEQQAEQAADDTEIWEDEPETEEEIILVDETVEDDGFEVESEAELMEEVALTESETKSVAEPVLTESETESVAEPVLTESGTESAAEPVLEEAVEYPARVFRGSTENVNVTVLAPEGAFPADTTMTVQDVSGGVINDITEAVSDDTTTVNKVYAVDITFTDGKGNEIEPLVPVKMTITAEEKQKTEETLVVHVSDEGNVEQVEDVIISDGRGASRARLTMEAGESGSAVQTDSGAEAIPESVVDSVEGTEDHEVVADAFSVYAIVYTVDFHYEVNGKMYEFSIPGGGFVSLEHVVEVLGIARIGENTVDSGENEANEVENVPENLENTADSDVYNGVEKTGVEEIDANGSNYEESISLNNVEVSEATRKFVADVASAEFSSPELVWVGKVDSATTVGGLKEANGLEVQYSADLTEEQITEINNSTVEAGDWALISVQPFTSEETLTVTMKNGDQFVVRVTDAQIRKTMIDAKGETWEITVTYGLEAGIPDGAELMVEEILPEDEEYQSYYQQSFEKIGVSTPIEKAGVREAIVASTTDGITGDIERVNDIIEIIDAEVESDESAIKPVSDYARIFNIEIWAGDQKVEPAADVTVNIKLLDAPEETEATPRVVHFAKEGAELMQLKEPFENSEDEGIRFVTDEFSVYSVVYTVDFSYEVNGKVYGFTMNGEDSVSLRALIEALHVYEKTADVGKKSDNDKGTEDSVTSEDLAESTPDQNNIEDIRALNDFMSAIKSVRFSDPELLTIVHADEDTTLGKLKADNDIIQQFSLWHPQKEVIERNAESYSAGDWVLVSLRPFDTKEELTIDLITGERFTIQVTDAQNAVMNPDGTVQTISNPAGTTIDLFDYWVDTDLRYNDGRSAWPGYYDGWNPSASQLGGTGNEAGINYGHALKFSPAWEHTVINGTNGTHNTNGANGLNSYTGGTSPFQGIVQNQLSNGYPILSTNETIGTDGESLAYLFNPAVSNGYKASYTDVNQLLYVDKDGYYTFDSRDYYARFHEDTSTFSVTEQTSSDSTIRGFWPFSEYGQRNFWLGMHVNTQFSMPAGGQVLNPSNELKPMQFEFSGDDDVWIYIDGVLVGDAGGIHNRTEVDINFQTGLVTITNSESKYLDDFFRQAGKYDDYEWNGHTFKDGTYHTFDFFYLERGGEESNLYIHYNLVSTADFTAHKSFHGTNEEDLLERDQFQFELIGLDGRYRSVWNEDADAYVLQQEDSTTKAIMPHATEGGTGTVASPSYNPATQTIVNGQTIGSQTYITGVTEDGNINFGTADISEQDMHDADENNPPVYKYIIREIVPSDAVNEAGITWADASEEDRAAGGFVKDDIIYDGTIYYMTGRVTSWTDTGRDGQPVTKHGLAKVYYTDDTYTTVRENTPFISFVNYFNAKHGNVEFTKVDEIGEGLAGATFGLFRDDACQIPAKMIDVDNSPWTATSDADGHVSFENVRTGIYYMKETEAPEGYALNDTVYKVVIEDAKDPLVSSKITILNDETQTQVTEIINTEDGKLKIIKKWLSSTGTEISGGTHSANVHLYRMTDNSQVPGSCTVSIVFHRSGSGWNLDTGTNGNVVIVENASSFDLTWHLGDNASHQLSNMRINGVSYSDAQNQVVDTGAGKVNWIPWNGSTSIMTVSDISSDMYIEFDSNCDWFSTKPAVSNRVPFVPPVIDTTPVLVDTITLSPSNNWNVIKQIGGTLADYKQEGYDLPATDNNGNRYLYYIVELNENRSEISIGENPLEGYSLQGYSVNNNTGVANQGVLIVYNQMETPPSTNITIKKVDINHLDETNPDFLKGAAFKLTKYTDATFRSIDTGWAEEGSKTLTDARNEDGTFTLNGIFEFQEIPVGYYILEETQYPDGYIKIMDNPAFQIQPKEAGNGLEIVQLVKGSGEEYQNGSTDTIRIENNTAIVYVANTPGAALPNTGGPGTNLIYLFGIMLTGLAGAGLVMKRRRRNVT